MKLWLKITLWFLGSVIALAAIVLGVALWLLTPEKLTPIINKYASQYLDADVRFERVEVSLWSDFPRVSLSIIDGTVVSNALTQPDTLLIFNKFDVSLDAWGLINMTGARVSRVGLDGARVTALIDSTGRASWDIVRPSADTSVSDTTSLDFGFDVRRVEITNSLKLRLRDLRDTTDLTLSLSRLDFDGFAGSDLKKLDIKRLAIDSLHVQGSLAGGQTIAKADLPTVALDKIAKNKGYKLLIDSRSTLIEKGDTLANQLPIRLSSDFDFYLSDKIKSLTLLSTEFTAGGLAAALEGKIETTGDSTITSDLTVKISLPTLDQIVGYIPSSMRGQIGRLSSNVALVFDSHISGTYNLNSGRLPHITAHLTAPSGFLSYQGTKLRVDNFALDLGAQYDPEKPELSKIVLENFIAVGTGIDIKASGSLSDFLRDPLLEAQIQGDIDLTYLSREFPSTRAMQVSGGLGFRTRYKGRTSDMYMGGLARTEVSGAVEMRNIYVNSPLDSLEFSGHGRFTFGSNKNTRDSSLAAGLPILRARLTLDTLKLKMLPALNVNGRGLSVAARTDATSVGRKGERRVYPFHGEISAQRLVAISADSSILRMRKARIDFDVKPSDTSARTPRLSVLVRADRVAATSGLSRYRLTNPAFKFDATVISKEQDSVMRSQAMLDRLQKRYPQVARKDLMLYSRMMRTVGIAKKDDLSAGDLDLKMDDDFLSILRRWRSTGELKVDSVRVATPYMPLPTMLSDLDLTFDNRSVVLRSSCFKVGRSDVDITGEVSNLDRALAGRGDLVMRLRVEGDTLDMNQLVIASNAGMNALDKVSTLITEDTTQEQAEQIIATQADAEPASQLVIIPKNIDLEIDLDVRQAYWGDVTMKRLAGSLIARDRILQINALTAESSIGQMEVNAAYATHSKTDITTGFDLVLRGVDVGELIDLIPEVDSMLPMLASFQGKLNCTFAATASLDSTMSVLIPTLNAAGSISGENLVLLDGQTFAEISKILKFKNKSRNMVERISVEMLVRNSAVELFPFILQMDRYKAAVSGVQKLDMSFDYHISVLKSIIPFRLGVDIYGNLDDWKFRITQARYKNENVPSYSALIDTTRIDLRRTITDIFTTGVKNLVLRDAGVVPHVDSTEMFIADSLSRTIAIDTIPKN